MDSQLSQETAEALRKLAREIGVAHDLDEEVQEELYGHMEDKALGYLSGEDEVSQADVVLLTREHFGDARRLKDYLSRVHRVEATATLARRLAAVTFATLAITAVTGVVRVALATILGRYIPYYPLSANAMLLDTFGPMIAGMISLFLTLSYWQQKLERGERVWFQTWSSSWLIILVLGILLITWCVPVAQVNVVAPGGTLSPEELAVRSTINNLLLSVFMFALPLIWVWWSDSRPRRAQAMLLGVAAYFVFQAAIGLRMLAGVPFLQIHDMGMDLTFVRSSLSNGIPSGALSTAIRSLMQSAFTSSIELGGALILYATLLLAHRLLPRIVHANQGEKPWISS